MNRSAESPPLYLLLWLKCINCNKTKWFFKINSKASHYLYSPAIDCFEGGNLIIYSNTVMLHNVLVFRIVSVREGGLKHPCSLGVSAVHQNWVVMKSAARINVNKLKSTISAVKCFGSAVTYLKISREWVGKCIIHKIYFPSSVTFYSSIQKQHITLNGKQISHWNQTKHHKLHKLHKIN